jgi:hypothetical protein
VAASESLTLLITTSPSRVVLWNQARHGLGPLTVDEGFLFHAQSDKILGAALLAIAISAATCHAIAGGLVTLIVTTKAEFQAGSTEAHGIQLWLHKNVAFANGQMVGDPAKLGDVHVTYTKIATSGTQPAVGDGPPVSLRPLVALVT